ncbi:hypothetical protein BU202_08135 [Streptococcus cuniculi]|uniref:Uncharacterized protein n=2 Tax=Streptococcus cuniculi TaxID=1432788 RepID=A0A1Q8E654_9STRE|nr:hypothetical protein BU202_08135 [Streptococcus cuniculi]QBX23143.1 hypothetical protein Javan116_0014 [Streptococcus phage Javan116]
MKITVEKVCANGYRLKSGYIERIVTTNKSIDDVDDFKYWSEQQRYYLTMNQFLIIDPEWLNMVIDVYNQRDELPI